MSEELRPDAYPGFMRMLNSLSGFGYGFDPMPLKDAPIEAVEVSEDKEELIFRLADGRSLTYHAEGDCCSTSWIEHLTVPTDIVGATVTAVGEQSMGERDGDHGWSTIKVYQTTFVTPRGEIVVEYRNESNGYYGGWLSGPIEAEA